jgi:hypothetical protein
VALNASHADPKDSIGSTDFAGPSTPLTTSVQSAPTGFAMVGQDPVDGNVVISWLHHNHHDDIVNLEAVMKELI